MNYSKFKIAIIGLGYVGLPLAVEFGKKFRVIGYDINNKRINELCENYDSTNEITKNAFKKSKKLKFTSNFKEIKDCNIFIITVPTPIYKNKKPNLSLVKNATKKLATILKKKDIVIFESTFYPGITEDVCVPILEKVSKLKYNKDFYCGYSPERINPSDKKHTLRNIVKLVSASNNKTLNTVDSLYSEITDAGTFRVNNIKTAEAAKVIENAQRDLNIAFVNELTQIFDYLKVNPYDVLEAASTKWNFLDFKPGLVGGHCIGVDPYYLTYESIKKGYQPKIILSGRKINDNYPYYIANKIITTLKNRFKSKRVKFKILLLGFTFKENCSDFRNSKSIDLFKYLSKKNITVDGYDPEIDSSNFFYQSKIKLLDNLQFKTKTKYHCIILAVPHNKLIKMKYSFFEKLLFKNGIFYDLKNIFKHKNNLIQKI